MESFTKKIAVLTAMLALFVVPMMIDAAIIRVSGETPTNDAIQTAVDAAAAEGDEIVISSGAYYGAKVNKSVKIRGEGNVIINDFPPGSITSNHYAFFPFLSGSDGSELCHLTLMNVTYTHECNGIFLDNTSNISIHHLDILNFRTGIQIRNVTESNISHNTISNFNRTGILFHLPYGGEATDNLVAQNTLTSQILDLEPEADARGAIALNALGVNISNNKIVKNKVEVNNPNGIQNYAIKLLETDGGTLVNNKIGFNDLRGSSFEFWVYPYPALWNANAISRNKGDNQLAGNRSIDNPDLSPSDFNPVAE